MPKNTYGIIPRMVVVIGDIVCPVKSAKITLTNKSEASTAELEIPLENIDSSIFTKRGNYYSVQIYAGYLDERTHDVDTFKDLIDRKKYKDLLFKRYDGFADQPEWSIGINGNMLSLKCKDVSGLLQDGKFSEKKEGSAASAKNIIAQINSNVKGIKVVFNHADFSMGKLDAKGNKQVYNISGKSYWDVIKDIAEKGNLNIQKEGTTITLTTQEKWKKKWTMVKTASKDPNKDWSNFTEVKFRYGALGSAAKEDILVEICASTPSRTRKSGKVNPGHFIIGRYPANSKSWNGEENVEVHRFNWPYPLTQAEANAKAKNKAMEYLRNHMTGEVEVPFANPEMFSDDGIDFKSDSNLGLTFLDGIVFRIGTIQESFDIDGYKQSVEFETDARFEQVQRVAPTNKQSQKLQTPPYTGKNIINPTNTIRD